MIFALGLILCSFILSSEARKTAAAPSFKELALAAVIVPSLSKAGLREVILSLLNFKGSSSISITEIASVTKRAEKVIGMHFMNPVPIMKLVEVIRGKLTTDEVTSTIMEMSKTLGKIPVEVNDAPGFVANRILMPMINEAIYTLHEKLKHLCRRESN